MKMRTFWMGVIIGAGAALLSVAIYQYIKSIDIPPCLRCELYRTERGCLYWIEFPEGHVPPAQTSIGFMINGEPTWVEALQVLGENPIIAPEVKNCPEPAPTVRFEVPVNMELR